MQPTTDNRRGYNPIRTYCTAYRTYPIHVHITIIERSTVTSVVYTESFNFHWLHVQLGISYRVARPRHLAPLLAGTRRATHVLPLARSGSGGSCARTSTYYVSKKFPQRRCPRCSRRIATNRYQVHMRLHHAPPCSSCNGRGCIDREGLVFGRTCEACNGTGKRLHCTHCGGTWPCTLGAPRQGLNTRGQPYQRRASKPCPGAEF